MTIKEIDYDELKQFVRDTYEHIAKRPAMFAGRVEAVEAFVFALELILDQFGGPEREGRYAEFKSASQFGNEPLLAFFERVYQCRLGFVGNGDSPTTLPAELFEKTFQEHWDAYLASLK